MSRKYIRPAPLQLKSKAIIQNRRHDVITNPIINTKANVNGNDNVNWNVNRDVRKGYGELEEISQLLVQSRKITNNVSNQKNRPENKSKQSIIRQKNKKQKQKRMNTQSSMIQSVVMDNGSFVTPKLHNNNHTLLQHANNLKIAQTIKRKNQTKQQIPATNLNHNSYKPIQKSKAQENASTKPNTNNNKVSTSAQKEQQILQHTVGFFMDSDDFGHGRSLLNKHSIQSKIQNNSSLAKKIQHLNPNNSNSNTKSKSKNKSKRQDISISFRKDSDDQNQLFTNSKQINRIQMINITNQINKKDHQYKYTRNNNILDNENVSQSIVVQKMITPKRATKKVQNKQSQKALPIDSIIKDNTHILVNNIPRNINNRNNTSASSNTFKTYNISSTSQSKINTNSNNNRDGSSNGNYNQNQNQNFTQFKYTSATRKKKHTEPSEASPTIPEVDLVHNRHRNKTHHHLNQKQQVFGDDKHGNAGMDFVDMLQTIITPKKQIKIQKSVNKSFEQTLEQQEQQQQFKLNQKLMQKQREAMEKMKQQKKQPFTLAAECIKKIMNNNQNQQILRLKENMKNQKSLKLRDYLRLASLSNDAKYDKYRKNTKSLNKTQLTLPPKHNNDQLKRTSIFNKNKSVINPQKSISLIKMSIRKRFQKSIDLATKLATQLKQNNQLISGSYEDLVFMCNIYRIFDENLFEAVQLLQDIFHEYEKKRKISQVIDGQKQLTHSYVTQILSPRRKRKTQQDMGYKFIQQLMLQLNIVGEGQIKNNDQQ